MRLLIPYRAVTTPLSVAVRAGRRGRGGCWSTAPAPVITVSARRGSTHAGPLAGPRQAAHGKHPRQSPGRHAAGAPRRSRSLPRQIFPSRESLQPWVHRLGFEGEYREDCLVDPPQRLAACRPFQRFEAERVLPGSQ